jgi:hypothetical protein
MELRNLEHPEPSHIHVPRPSRADARSARLPRPVYLDLCAIAGDDPDCATARDEAD